MLHGHRPAGAPSARWRAHAVRQSRRTWRRRSRRAQVSAVATILGLLLVVTFLANYISTTLPNTMGQNDLQRGILVQNQVATLGALAQKVALSQRVGAQVTAPISLGSAGDPPFAGPDSGALGPLANGTGLIVNFTLTGPGGVVPVSSQPASATSGFEVNLLNTYAPDAQVAYEQGAAVYAQPSSIPIFVLPPRISFANGALQMFLPQFVGRVPLEAGSGTGEVALRLLTTTTFEIPGGGYSFLAGSHLTITVTTAYAAGWYAYFETVSSLAPYLSCTGVLHVCTALYEPNGPLGKIVLSIPTSGMTLDLLVGVYAFSLG
jgi:hypothetical protein